MTLLLVLALALVLAVAYRIVWDRAGGTDAPPPRPSDVAQMWRGREQARAERREQARRRRLPQLPAADAPPAGLAPLIPSPRTVRVEAARGICELESWLAGQASA
ncbi:MAG TPA: hypothetical protein VM433_08100 [Mycobacteriales bacterium]|nr:hypothetical protein [Mycobacteriales bacterium]